ncbi:MAG: hypothetical protein ABII90_00010 [Bacteroidota bacterium]
MRIVKGVICLFILISQATAQENSSIQSGYPDDSLQSNIELMLSLNFYTKKNYSPEIGEMGIFLKPFNYFSFDLFIKTKKKNYHSIGINHLGLRKITVSEESEGRNRIEGCNQYHFFIQLKYQYDFVFFKNKNSLIKPHIAIGIIPFYHEGENYYSINQQPYRSDEQEYFNSYGILSQLLLACRYQETEQEKIFIDAGIKTNIYNISNEEYWWNNSYFSGYNTYEKTFQGKTKTISHHFIDGFLDKKYLIESVFIGIGYRF